MDRFVRFAATALLLATVANTFGTIIVFQGSDDLGTAGDRIVGPPSPSYQEGEGWTPNVVMDFGRYDPFNFARLGDLHLWLGGGSYGDIYPALWAEDGNVAQVLLVADEGYTVKLHGWRMGGWPSTPQNMSLCKVLDGSHNVLWDSGASNSNPFVVAGTGNTAFSFDPPIEASIIRIHWGHSSVIGSGHFSFSQSPTPGPSIVGNVALENFEGPIESESVEIEVRELGTTNVLESDSVALDADGNFVFTSSLTTGSYDVAIKVRHWLRSVETPIALVVGQPTVVEWTLTNGDVDGDNEVTLVDYGQLAAAFGTADGDANWNSNADLDGDGEVTLVDAGILGAHFGEAGDD